MSEIQVEQSSRETGTRQGRSCQQGDARRLPSTDPLRRRRDSEKNAPSRWSESEEWIDFGWQGAMKMEEGKQKRREQEEDKEKQRE